MQTFTQSSTVTGVPVLPFEAMKNTILGKRYELTLNFVGSTRARTLNQTSRGKDYVPNVLSFPLTEACGEIYICPQKANQEAKSFGMTPTGHLGYLYVHGLLHLKGLDHGAEMETLEKKYSKQFKLS